MNPFPQHFVHLNLTSSCQEWPLVAGCMCVCGGGGRPFSLGLKGLPNINHKEVKTAADSFMRKRQMLTLHISFKIIYPIPEMCLSKLPQELWDFYGEMMPFLWESEQNWTCSCLSRKTEWTLRIHDYLWIIEIIIQESCGTLKTNIFNF